MKAAFELQTSCAFEKPNKYLQQLVIVYQEWSAWHWLAANVVKEINLQTNWNNLKVTLENSWHFATPPPASWRNDVWGASTETPYSWHVTTMIWLVLLIGWHNLFSWNKQSELLKIQIWVATIIDISDFVTNTYGESWDSSCETSGVPVQNQWFPVQKKRDS